MTGAMKKLILLPLAALAFAATANAETVSVEPGLWDYEYTALLAGLPINQSGSECIAPENADLSLQAGAADLDNDCVISNTHRIEGGYTFTLTCLGNIAGEGSGKIVSTGDTLTLSLEGKAGPGGVLAPFNIDGTAKRAGGC